jgi:hypothetical protein
MLPHSTAREREAAMAKKTEQNHIAPSGARFLKRAILKIAKKWRLAR